MSRSRSALNALRPSLPSFSPSSPSPIASCSYLPPSRTFTTTSPTAVADKYARSRAVKAFYAAKKNRPGNGIPDYILGHINAESQLRGGRLEAGAPLQDLWSGCRLARTLIHPQAVWNAPIPNYAAGERPRHLLPGLSDGDREVLFGALPHVTTALKYDPSVTDEEVMNCTIGEQEKQSEMLYRIMDLRNADRRTINSVNRQRVIEEFGGGTDTGSSIVQVALLTMQIRGLNEHLLANPKDTHNRFNLRTMIHQRAKHFKYIKRKYPDRYLETLSDIGVDRRAVEGEITLPF